MPAACFVVVYVNYATDVGGDFDVSEQGGQTLGLLVSANLVSS